MQSPRVYDPLTKLQCCPTSEGAGCAIIVSEAFVQQHSLQDRAVEIVGMSLVTDTAATLSETPTMAQLAGADMTRLAARQVYEEAGVRPGK